MMARKLTIAIVALQLAGCASLAAGDPALYQGLAESDVEMASRLAQATLEDAPDGATRGWTNPQTGNRGEITPLRTYVSERGYFCRDYREELAVAGEEGRFYHTACRDDAAGWTWLWGSAAARSAGAVRGDLSRCSIHEVDARAKTPEQVADSSH